MKRQVYLFDESSPASTYGVGTYIRQLINCLTGISGVTLYVVRIGADVEYFEIRKMPGYDLYNIPRCCMPQLGNIEKYQKSIYYLIRLNHNINRDNHTTFIFNYTHHLPLIQYLKAAFPNGYFYFVVHYQNWAFSLNGDVVHLKQVLHNKDVSTLSISDQGVYRSFLDERKLYQTVDRVICLSQFTLSLIKELYDVSDDKINLIYNGLKDKNHLFTENGREILKAQYYFSASEKIILFVGRLNPIKGIDLIIRAFQVVLNQYPNCRLVVIGDGDFSFCFNACGANWSKITFTGRLNEEQVYDFYRIADVGVMPSMHEQCSYVAIEMMMFGLPMIVSTTTGLREMVNDKESGYIFDFLSCEMPEKELANLILKILTTPFHDQQKMRHMSRILYEERYSIEKMQNAYLRLI